MVFDSEFVEQNVYSGFEVRADQRQSLLEFALGNQTVQLKQQIDQLTKDIATQTGKKSQAERTLTGFATPYPLAQFIALQPVADAQQQIDGLQKRIEAAKNVPQLAARKDPTELAAIQFDVPAVFTVLKTQVQDVEEAAEAVVKAHLAKHKSGDYEDWVSRGQNYLSGADCPFCGQGISGLELISAYRSHFNKAYADLKRQVAGLESQVTNGLADSKIEAALAAAATNTARIEAWKDELVQPAQALEQVVVDGHHHFLAGLLLAVADDLLVGVDVLPLQGHTIAETRAGEVAEEDQRAPVLCRCVDDELLDLLVGEHPALRRRLGRQLDREHGVLQDDPPAVRHG